MSRPWPSGDSITTSPSRTCRYANRESRRSTSAGSTQSCGGRSALTGITDAKGSPSDMTLRPRTAAASSSRTSSRNPGSADRPSSDMTVEEASDSMAPVVKIRPREARTPGEREPSASSIHAPLTTVPRRSSSDNSTSGRAIHTDVKSAFTASIRRKSPWDSDRALASAAQSSRARPACCRVDLYRSASRSAGARARSP